MFTRPWVVELLLDLVGYTPDRDLARYVIAEPACGRGAFLGPIARRLSESCRRHGRSLDEALHSVTGFDLLADNVESSRATVRQELAAHGWGAAEVHRCAEAWVRQGDYLLDQHRDRGIDYVVGNPPYIRLEDVPAARMSAYRAAYPTMGGRADIYVGFYEAALRSLNPDGALGFICADRWMHNQYGSHLREFVTRSYSVDAVISMHDVDAFEEQVAAYPAITVISNRAQGEAVAVETSGDFSAEQAGRLRKWMRGDGPALVEETGYQAARLPHWFSGSDFWPSASPARLAFLEDLSDRFPVLQDPAGTTRVGIGIATGADKVFITTDPDAVEPERLLPLATVRDTASGTFAWQGRYLINPWTPAGDLVSLQDFPKVRRHFSAHADALQRRYVAVKQPHRWYKTIDKVDHSLIGRPKLLLPDMKTTIHPVLDEGGFYPHHNLYYIVSDTWDLRVLGGLLLSGVAQAFVHAYGVKMRGGTLRFQAQYLRKIRVPHPEQIGDKVQAALRDAFERRDVAAATQAALDAYRLDELPD
ncbi:Eco57I restriction-modification methylase domain-containing protein [Streptomonospora salina]